LLCSSCAGRLWTPSRCKTQWADSVYVVYDEVLSSLSGASLVPFPSTAEDNPFSAIVTPRRLSPSKQHLKQETQRQEAITNTIATPRSKQVAARPRRPFALVCSICAMLSPLSLAPSAFKRIPSHSWEIRRPNGGQELIELSVCERCSEASFAGSFTGLGTRNQQPGFTLIGKDGLQRTLCQHLICALFGTLPAIRHVLPLCSRDLRRTVQVG
jgi:hypothetical protein